MQFKLAELIDAGSLQSLMDSLHSMTGVSVAIRDVEGEIVIASGWSELCKQFHLAHTQSAALCDLSFSSVKELFVPDIPFIIYQCPHGLYGSAAPIYLNGTLLGAVYTGQYLREVPDIEFFKEQASYYQYNEDLYLKAVEQIPILKQDRVDQILVFFSQMAELLAKTVYVQSLQLKSKNLALQESEEKYQSIINNMPGVALQSYDRRGRILYWNKASEQIFGWTVQEVKGKTLDQFMLTAIAGYEFRKSIRTAGMWKRPIGPSEWKVRAKDGTDRILMSTIFAIRFGNSKEYICMDVDITERRKWEKELQRLDRLNIVGQLAASIGHEVRNPMTTVRGYLQFLQNKEETKSLSQQFAIMIEEIDRANAIVTEFLTLANNKVINPVRKNLNDIISALTPLLAADALVGNHILKVNLTNIPDALLDEKEVRQLVLNLTRNAFEAMGTGGHVTIETYADESYAVLAVKDTGPGIPQDILERLGTPFVTTKENGTGLGLAVCYSIAARHQAQIMIQNTHPGACFSVRFKGE